MTAVHATGNYFDQKYVALIFIRSRGIGNQLASYHIRKAKGLMKEYLGSLEDPDLAHFTEGTPEFDAYIKDMLWAQRYAYESRARMNRQLLTSLAQVVKPSDPDSERAMTVRVINCHHNYTEREYHLGRDLWITRKGAIKAGAGDLGVIPGSMGTDTYIVRGKGNPASYPGSRRGRARVRRRAGRGVRGRAGSVCRRDFGPRWCRRGAG